MFKLLAAVFVTAGLLIGPLAYVRAQQGFPQGNIVGPGTTSNAAVNYVNMAPLTVATLPACNAATIGMRAFVSDGTTPAYNTALVGGGAVFVEAHCTLATAGTYRWVGY